MDENSPTCKSFDQKPSFDLATLPPLLARLLEGKQLYSGLSDVDLREMAKFEEQANLAGLAAYPLRRPAPEARRAEGGGGSAEGGMRNAECKGQNDQVDRASEELSPENKEKAKGQECAGVSGEGALALSLEPLLPGGVRKALERELAKDPCLVVRGALAGGGAAPFAVQVLVPQKEAHLAAALNKLLWPLPEPEAEAKPTGPQIHYTLLQWPEPLVKKTGQVIVDEFTGHWPEDRLGLVIGFDDPRLAVKMILDAARRYWESAGPGGVELKLIPAGEAVVTVERGEASLARLTLLKSRPPEGGTTNEGKPLTEGERVASQEPFLLEGGEWLTPVWRNPILPATLLGRDPAWRTAALSVGAVPLRVEIDEEGKFPLFHGPMPEMAENYAEEDAEGNVPNQGWVIIPRQAVPEPFVNEAQRYLLKQ